MFYQPIGDSAFLAKLAYDLYTKGWQIVKHAPEEFGDLQDKLKFTRATLLWIENNLRRDDNELVKKALEKVNTVLNEHYVPIVEKFEKLSSTDQRIFFKQVQFAASRKEIAACKEKLFEAQEQLRWALDAHQFEYRAKQASTNSKAAKQASVTDATEDENRLDEGNQGDEESPIQSLDRHEESENRQISIQDFQKSARKEEGFKLSHKSLYESSLSPPSSSRTLEAHSAGERNLSNTSSLQTVIPPRMSKAAETTTVAQPDDGTSSSSMYEHAFLTNRNMFVIHRRDLEAALRGRMLSLTPDVESKFGRALNTSEIGVNLDSWITFAFWWFFKSRYVWKLLTQDETTNSASRTEITLSQSTLDLLKSDFILRRRVLEELPPGSEVTAAQWTSIQNLADGIRDEQRRREGNSVKFCGDNEHELDYALIEDPKQNVEYPISISDRITVPRAIDTLESTEKWLKIEPDHAGAVHGELIYRGFVNASIGPTELMRKTQTAPYLLVLSSPSGDVNPVISLINQSGTVKLSRRMTEDDLQANENIETSSTTFKFEFPSQNAIIDFLCKEELDKFLERPRKFFEATQERYPRDGEFLAFREVVDSFDDMRPDKFSRLRPSEKDTLEQKAPEEIKSRRIRSLCEVSLYENIPSEAYWKMTRRLVVCSSANDLNPWSLSFWLPLSKVNIAFDTKDKSLTLIWSDFKNHSMMRSGTFWYYHSYNCNPDKPNREIRIWFRSAEAVEAFAAYILNPFDSPFEVDEYIAFLEKFDTTPDRRLISVFEIHDPNTATIGYYRAIVTIDRIAHSRLCVQVYFAARYLDYKLKTDDELSVEICDLTVPNYVSNMQQLEEPLDFSEGPQLRDINSIAKSSTFKFSKSTDLVVFMGLLIPSWNWEWHGCAKTLVLSRRFKKSQLLKDVNISLWRKSTDSDVPADASDIHMTARSTQSADTFWITAKLDHGSHFDSKDRKIVVIEPVASRYGTTVDTVEMEAANASRYQRNANQSGKITISFEDDEPARWFTGLTSLPIGKWIPDRPVRPRGNLLPAQLVRREAAPKDNTQLALEGNGILNGRPTQSTGSGHRPSRLSVREGAEEHAPHPYRRQTGAADARLRSEDGAPDLMPKNHEENHTVSAASDAGPSTSRNGHSKDSSEPRIPTVGSPNVLVPFRTQGGTACSYAL